MAVGCQTMKGQEMNDSYEIFPKVVSVGQTVRIVVRGLRARTISPGWIYNVEICSMTDHSDNTRIKALALPPTGVSLLCEPSRGAVLEFYHTFRTRGEYRIIVRWDDESAGKIDKIEILNDYMPNVNNDDIV